MNDTYWLENFNTTLSPENEMRFQKWILKQSKNVGRNLAADIANYDLRGYWRANAGRDVEASHLPDTYKKPNHPSFSNESKYSGMRDPWGGKFMGGRWIGDEKSGWSFQPSKRMLQITHNPQQLQQYFADNEPGVGLVMPTVYMRR